MRPANPIRVIVADDHHLVRQGIRSLLEKAEEIEVVGEASDGCQAVELVERLAPDVLVTDIAMPRLDGNQAVARIRALGAETRVVMLSMYSEESLVRQALRNGAQGYLLKRSVAAELILAVRAADRGELYLSPAISGSIVTEMLDLEAETGLVPPSERLTAREREVLQLISEGHTNQAIARILTISVKTVEKHRASLMCKLNVHDLAGLMRAGIKQGLILLDE